MSLAGVSVRRVEDMTEALWGTRVSPSTVSDLNKKLYANIEAWRNQPIEGCHPYVYLDGVVLKRTWAGAVRNVSLLVAIGVTAEGYRKILGICEGTKQDKAGRSGFLRHLKDRGLSNSVWRPRSPLRCNVLAIGNKKDCADGVSGGPAVAATGAMAGAAITYICCWQPRMKMKVMTVKSRAKRLATGIKNKQALIMHISSKMNTRRSSSDNSRFAHARMAQSRSQRAANAIDVAQRS